MSKNNDTISLFDALDETKASKFTDTIIVEPVADDLPPLESYVAEATTGAPEKSIPDKKMYPAVSPSMIGNLLECPHCLWTYFVDGIKRPEGIFPSLPNGIDLAMKAYFDDFRRQGKLPPEVDSKVDGILYQEMTNLNRWRTNWQGISSVFDEYNLMVKGAIDELLVDKDGKFIPFDFKTRGFPLKADTAGHYQMQLDFYGLLFQKNGFPISDHGYLMFLWPKSFQNNSFQFNSELITMDVSPKRAIGALEKVAAILAGSKPEVNMDCSYCSYRFNHK